MSGTGGNCPAVFSFVRYKVRSLMLRPFENHAASIFRPTAIGPTVSLRARSLRSWTILTFFVLSYVLFAQIPVMAITACNAKPGLFVGEG